MKEKIQILKQFVNDVKIEMKKVSWTKRKELIAATSAVIVTVFLIAIFLGIVDIVLARMVGKLIHY